MAFWKDLWKIALLLLLSSAGHAAVIREQHRVSGTVLDCRDSLALYGALVTFTDKDDSTVVFNTVTDENGIFHTEVAEGNYILSVFWYDRYYYPKEYSALRIAESTDLGTVYIDTAIESLDEVTITANAPFVRSETGKLIYNIKSNPAAKGSNALDGLALIPGIQISPEQDMKLYGFYTVTVYINNRPVRMSREELNGYLASMSVEDIESVELIRNPGPEYGKNVQAVVNIVTDHHADDGINGFINGEAAWQRIFSGRAAGRMNFNKGKSHNFIGYSYNRNGYITTTGISGDSSGQGYIDTTIINPKNLHIINVGSDWNFSPFHTIGAYASGSFTDETMLGNGESSVKLGRRAMYVNLYHTLSADDRKWKWNLNLDYSSSSTDQEWLSESYNGLRQNDDYSYLSGQASFFWQFLPSWNLFVGAEVRYSKYDTDRSDKSSDRDVYLYDELNAWAWARAGFEYGNVSGYAGFQLNRDSRTGEYTSLDYKTDSTWWQPQPYASLTWDIAQDHKLNVNFTTYYSRPTFRDLLPYTSTSSSLFYREGNPDLRSSHRYLTSLSYTFMNAAMLEVSYSDEHNPIVEYISYRENQGTYVFGKMNLYRTRYMRVMVGLPIPAVNRKESGLFYLISTYAAFQRQWDEGGTNTVSYDNAFSAFFVQHRHSLTLPGGWYIDLQGVYYSPLTAGIYRMQHQWWMDMTVSKQIKAFKLSLTGHDLLNSNIARGRLLNDNIPISFYRNWNRPRITLTVSCTIGGKLDNAYRDRKHNDGSGRTVKEIDSGISL